jgi:hypothetical protein
MTRTTIRQARIGAACLGALLLTGCWVDIPYTRVGENDAIDPANGHMIRTTHWQYRDGVTVDTVDDINANGGNDTRRTEPPQRSHFFDLF